MFCADCGKKIPDAKAAFCPSCGKKVPGRKVSAKAKTAAASKKSGFSTETHPWLRYFARSLDGMLFGFALGLLIELLAPDVTDMFEGLSGILIFALWIPLEAYLLTVWGTTPGKWMMGLRVHMAGDKLLTFEQAIRRSGLVFVKGMGLGIPLVSFITTLYAYSVLRRTGSTTWDRDVGSTVSYVFPGGPRIALAIGLVVLLVVLIAIGAAAEV